MRRHRHSAEQQVEEPVVEASKTLPERIANLREQAKDVRSDAAYHLAILAAIGAAATGAVIKSDASFPIVLGVLGGAWSMHRGTQEVLEALQIGQEIAALEGAKAVILSQTAAAQATPFVPPAQV